MFILTKDILGTNFDRPEFQRMISDIEKDKINMVVTKDLSRLGRDYIGTGEYIEKWFPEKNIRYVSVNDGIDTFAKNNGNNDIAPFKSILNDMYSKDLSKKIRTALHTMQKQGKWVGGRTPLGYIQDPNDKNHLIICEEEAKIVRTIYDMAEEGNSVGTIRKYLEDNNIPTADQIRHNRATFWTNNSIKKLLRREIYIGVTIQNKRSRISYKNRKLKENPKEEWFIVENTHEPIIETKKFEKVQKMEIAQKYSRNEKKNYTLLGDLLFCYECGHRIGLKRKNARNTITIICNNYRRNSKLGICTSHGFRYDYLEEAILQYIRKLFSAIDSEKIELNMKNSKTTYDYKQLIENSKKEIELIKNKMDKMYMDKLDDKISEEMYQRVLNKYEIEIKEKERQCIEWKKIQQGLTENNSEDIKKIVKEFLSLETPTPELMKIIINKINIHQDKQVDILFNFKELNKIKTNAFTF